MQFSIITPGFRSSPWLRLCVESVADQGVSLEHIVQDAGSDDGTLEWLTRDTRVRAFVEKDQGMYDALNRGFRRSGGEILAWLNCDEQYLSGALRQVADRFATDPALDMLFGNVVMIDSRGDYLWHRKMQVPMKYHTWTCHLSTLSCGMFFRRRILFERNAFFNSSLRDVGDGEWMLRLMQQGIRMGILGEFTSAFTQTGANMSAAPNARREARELRSTAPLWARAARPLLILHHRLRRWAGGMYRQRPFSYEVFTRESPRKRVRKHVEQPRFRSAS
jgi:glycosyltransferase involved in cell wall biosynthesis